MWLLRGLSPERRAERRELEERNRQQWERTSRSFARAAVCCSRQARWSEPRVPPRSAVAERRERLEERRERLRRLLREEREALSAELRERRRGGMRSEERGTKVRARPDRARPVPEQLLQEHWKENNTELQEVMLLSAESQLHKKHVIEAWGDQLTNKNKEEVTELEEKKRYENKYEMARREELERVRQEEKKHQLEKKNQAEMLLQQIEELKLQEAETKKLKKEKENLLKQQWELENLEEERKQMEEHRRQKELGRFLRHQCGAQLKRRAQQIQEELETDRQILSALLERENENHLRQLGCREQGVADVAWMKRVIEEQLQLEKEREAELETLFTEEAKKVWEMMKEQWEREKVARDRLMNEVFAGRQRQIQEKIKLNRRAQEETLKYREQLIRELEEAKELSRREKEQEEELKTAHRQELEAQGTERRWQEEEEQWREEEKEERWARQRHKELVQQEGERRVYSYPKAPWT
ncbi:PREDICTED: trichoplein keratin filament-binding protein [Lepidothrix coronata]|uniref:Trichoplein keratin filament-binding protein n=1 Tax=Lepidothrix coronata TaxID=321398 RepID=A0A6J0H5R6_9PASS|nr:PREDICTED: trichoplein keratin filament-binding protein [Lepidothrix coronata]